MIAYPYPVALGIQDSGSIQTEDGAKASASSSSNADQIWRYKPGGGFDGAWLFDSQGTIAGGTYDNQWFDIITNTPSTMSIDVDQGFYYYRQPGNGDFNWSPARPFSLP
jgi:hypothetical protein